LLEVSNSTIAAFETFDRLDAAAFHLPHGDQAGTDLPPVEQDRTGAAIAGVAADLGAGDAEIVAQRRGQSRDRRAVPVRLASIEGELEFHAATSDRRRRSRTRATSPR